MLEELTEEQEELLKLTTEEFEADKLYRDSRKDFIGSSIATLIFGALSYEAYRKGGINPVLVLSGTLTGIIAYLAAYTGYDFLKYSSRLNRAHEEVVEKLKD